MKRIAVLTSGGDSPGMNAAIRAVLRAGIYNDLEVYGIKDGYTGLIEGNLFKMDLSSVADIIHRGGTILKSSRSEEFRTEEGQKKAVSVLRVFGIEGLVVIGGDGSFRGANDLAKKGISVIGVPGTIDNDLGYTDYTIGFDTVINTVVEAISRIRDTTESHGRASIIEVMGRKCGDIALYAGLAGGADSIIVPEKDIDIDCICRKLLQSKNRGKKHSIIVFAEGKGDITPYELGARITENTGIETRVTILGHLQRGGIPTAADRILASKLGAEAVHLLVKGESSRMLGVKGKEIIDMDIDEGLSIKKELDEDILDLANELSI